jgi:hypothetical protein
MFFSIHLILFLAFNARGGAICFIIAPYKLARVAKTPLNDWFRLVIVLIFS